MSSHPRFALLVICVSFSLGLPAQTTTPQQRTLMTFTEGVPLAGLNSSNIELRVDGHVLHNAVASVIGADTLPLRIGVVIDESGSGRGSGLQGVLLQHTLGWATRMLQRTGGDAFLVAFNDQIITSTELVTDVARLRGAADQLRPIGGSAVKDALVHTAQKFDSLAPEPSQAVRLILFLSDGFDNASCADERRAIEAAQRDGVRVYALTFPSPEATAGKHLLDNIVQSTGGRAFSPSTDPEVTSALATIEHDLANSFVVTFTPEARDGKFHRLTFAVQGVQDPGLRFTPAFAASKR